MKLGSFMFYRDMIMDLIHFAEKNFWNVTYNEVDTQILEGYDKLGMTMVYTFTLIVYVATFNYVFAPFFGIVMVFAYVVLAYVIFQILTWSNALQQRRSLFTFYRASRDKWNEDSTVQTVVWFSISLAILRNYLYYTGNSA